MKRGIVFSLCICFQLTLLARDLTSIDFNYLYDPAHPVQFEYRLVLKGNVLSVVTKQGISPRVQWSYFSQESYSSVEEVTVTPLSVDSLGKENEVYLRYNFSLTELRDLLVFSCSVRDRAFYYPIEVKPERIPSFLPVHEFPVVDDYVSSLPSFGSEEPLYAYIYGQDFGTADPPFGNMQALSPVLEIDTLLSYQDSKYLVENAFYFLQQDTSSSIGSGFLHCPPYFPRYRRIEELAATMQYICSIREYESIITAANRRDAFENFWIKVAGGKTEAKRAIRNYFRRVTGANLYFTNYKPGWQTDQGMIYMVYGRPDKVERTDRKEIWIYNRGEKFEFVKISTLFTPQLYTLIRDPDYRDSWTLRIKGIRAGT